LQALQSYIDDHPVGSQFQSQLVQDFARIVVADDSRIAATPLARLSVADEYFIRIDCESAADAGLIDPEYRDRVTWGLRSPRDRNSEFPRVPKTTYPVELLAHANAFGSSGWNADGFSKWVGFDFDGPNHSDGCTHKQLADVVDAVRRYSETDPNVTLRTSKSGQGYHILYTFPERVPTRTGTHHQQLAAVVLNVMSERADFDFSSVVDCGGGGKVLFHWARNIAADGLTTLDLATTENLNNVI